VLDIAFTPDRGSDVAIARQLAQHLAGLIDAGRLTAGTRLPPAREVASALRLGRNTVNAAYAQLAARGLTTGHVGRGTFVASRTTPPRPTVVPLPPREFGWAGLFARAGRSATVSSLLRRVAITDGLPFDFGGGRVDPDALPVADLRWAFARPFQTKATLRAMAAHRDPRGWPPLRREIARRLTERGIACDAADVAIVSGLQHAIDLTARTVVDPGDAVVMEQPGYFGAALAFAGCGADVLGVDVDQEGLDTDRLARLLRVRRVKLVYVTPAAQSPTGVVLSDARRAALMALADEYQVPIFEDDYDSELRWDTPARPALKAGDRAGQIVYAGTFSKVLFPGLRVGWVVAARPLLERLVTIRALADFGTGVVEQAALATLLATRGLERHVRRMRRLYAERLAALQAALAREMPDGVRWLAPQGGHLVWVTLPAGLDPERLQHAAHACGVVYARGELFFTDGRGGEHLGLAFTSLGSDAIADGIARLAGVIREQLAARTRRTAHTRQPAPRRRTRRSHAAH
jgi:DNA-binding transcriptional MocR family regulator